MSQGKPVSSTKEPAKKLAKLLKNRYTRDAYDGFTMHYGENEAEAILRKLGLGQLARHHALSPYPEVRIVIPPF
jgi:hypothetical protein